MSNKLSISRDVRRVVRAIPAADGAGVMLKRSIASPEIDHVDPFLLLDEFRSDDPNDYIAGFPMHPHRGIETVTYMLAGSMKHEDSLGNTGNLGAGDVQWMTAGSGIIHSEMPMQKDGLMWGFQLWVNLPRRSKMTAPRYQDIPARRIPEVKSEGGATVRVIAGRVGEVEGPVRGIAVDPLYLDVRVPPETVFRHPVPLGHQAVAYLFEGEGRFGVSGAVAGPSELVIFRDGHHIELRTGTGPVRFLLIAGRPLGEPIARYGPFVMNTEEEIRQAFRDYRSGTLVRSVAFHGP